MTWRERIQAGRERGFFTGEDYWAWASPLTCMVGEQQARYGVTFDFEMGGLDARPIVSSTSFLQGPGGNLQTTIFTAISCNAFDDLDRLLDAIEDRALALKREQT